MATATNTNYPLLDNYVKRIEIANLIGGITVSLGNYATGGSIGTAPNTVDSASSINIAQTTASQTLTIPNPTVTTTDHEFTINNIGSTSFTVLSTVISPGAGILVQWTGAAYSVIGTSSGATNVTVVGGKTFTVDNTLTLAGTDGTTMTFPGTSATMARTDAANTFTGHQTIEGVTSTGATGTGNFVFSTSPTLVTPVLGAATGTSLLTSGKIGYTGVQEALTQLTNKSTTVTSSTNAVTAAITMNNASLTAAASVTFTFANTSIAATDVIHACVKSGASTGLYTAQITAVGTGTCNITVTNIGSTASEAPVLNVAIFKCS